MEGIKENWLIKRMHHHVLSQKMRGKITCSLAEQLMKIPPGKYILVLVAPHHERELARFIEPIQA